MLLTLTATIQGPANAAGSTVFRAALANKDILKALAQAAPNGGFSSAAKLLLVTPSNTGASRFVVRDMLNGTNRDTDISSWFTNSVLASVPNSAPAARTQYALERLVLTSDLLSLDSQALAAISWPSAAATATLLGAGIVTNAPALFQGTLTLGPAKFEKPAQ